MRFFSGPPYASAPDVPQQVKLTMTFEMLSKARKSHLSGLEIHVSMPSEYTGTVQRFVLKWTARDTTVE